MKPHRSIAIGILILSAVVGLGEAGFSVAAASPQSLSPDSIREYCVKDLSAQSRLPGSRTDAICSLLRDDNGCVSEQGRPIPYYEKIGTAENPIRILVFGQIHGDESDAGRLSYQWIERLNALSPKNSWRIIPRLNPDGERLKTRMNAHGVDLNRNFPTRDWNELATRFWKKRERSNPRRFPGSQPGTENEVRCAIEQIEAFHPDIIVSVHTPYALLDFDGNLPANLPHFGLPWRPLGTYPGSLGRYMWVERHIPVLTIELGPHSMQTQRSNFDRLQDFISFLAISSKTRPTQSHLTSSSLPDALK